MPLHDWSDDRGWDSVHPIWLTYLLEWLQPRLPEGYKAFSRRRTRPDGWIDQRPAGRRRSTMGSTTTGHCGINRYAAPGSRSGTEHCHSPGATTGGPRRLTTANSSPLSNSYRRATKIERTPGRLTLGGTSAIFVWASIFSSSTFCRDRWDSHLPMPSRLGWERTSRHWLHHSRPLTASAKSCPSVRTWAVSSACGDVHSRSGTPLPSLPLPLSVHEGVIVDLEETYSRAAKRAYLE